VLNERKKCGANSVRILAISCDRMFCCYVYATLKTAAVR